MLEQMVFWHWLALGLALSVAEILLPGTYLLWLGLGAATTGAVVWVAGPALGWKIQIAVFAACSVISLVIGRWVMRRGGAPSDHPDLNRRADRLIGRRCVLEDVTAHGRGRVRIDDTLWNAQLSPAGDEAPKGTYVDVVGVDGTTLLVRPVDATASP